MDPRLGQLEVGEKRELDLLGMEEWIRNLAGVLAAGIGIEQAVIATHCGFRAQLRDKIRFLVQRLRTQSAAASRPCLEYAAVRGRKPKGSQEIGILCRR